MGAEKTGPPPSLEEGKAGLGQFVQNDQTDTLNQTKEQDAYPGTVGSRLMVGAARLGLVSWAEMPVAGERSLPPGPAMFTLAGGRFVLFHPFLDVHAARAALRRRYKQLAALGIANPKAALGPARLTPLASTSARGRAFAHDLGRRGVEVSDIPLPESWPDEHAWLDSLLWRPPPQPTPRVTGGGQSGALVMDVDTGTDMESEASPIGNGNEPNILPPEAIPGVTKAGLAEAMADDRAWFERHPGASVRERPFIPGEAPPPRPGYEARVKVTQEKPGFRTREIIFHPIGENASTGDPSSPWARK
jgi:hypothetical protein